MNFIMEDAMAALKDRQQARESLQKVFSSLLDKMIPPDAATPLPGGRRFVDWEELGNEVERQLIPHFLEQRAALDAAAHVEGDLECPHCGSDRIYMIKPDEKGNQVEIPTPHGAVVIEKQRCRCRACGRSFSPSGALLGVADGGESVAEGQE